MHILDGSILPGDLVRVDAAPDSDEIRFEPAARKVEETKVPEPKEAHAEAARPGAAAARAGRKH
jgi:hypothetical protein